MIYYQSIFIYLAAMLLMIRIFIVLKLTMPNDNNSIFPFIFPLIVILHPLAIDSLLGPNLIPGYLAFYIFTESILFQKKQMDDHAFILQIIASFFNFTYGLIGLYSYARNRKNTKISFSYVIVYIALLIFFMEKHTLFQNHSSLAFLSYIVPTIILPMSLSIINYSTYPFFLNLFLLSSTILIFLWFLTTKKNPDIKKYFYYIFFSSLGVYFHPWHESYIYWHEFLFSGSTYLCIIYSLFMILAEIVPKPILIIYLIFIISCSALWSYTLIPLSNSIKYSLKSLPINYEDTYNIRRMLAWELIYEKKLQEGRSILKELIKDSPAREEAVSDLIQLHKEHPKLQLQP